MSGRKGWLLLFAITMGLPCLLVVLYVVFYVAAVDAAISELPAWAQTPANAWMMDIPQGSAYIPEFDGTVSQGGANVPWVDYSGPDGVIGGVPLRGPIRVLNTEYDLPYAKCDWGDGPAQGYTMLGGKGHNGVDFPVNVGTPVYTTMGGQVVWAGPNGGWGGLVVIQNGGYLVFYAHLSAVFVLPGDIVPRGMVVGATGGAQGDPLAGNSSGAHLHYGVRHCPDGPQSCKFVDPNMFMNPSEYGKILCNGSERLR